MGLRVASPVLVGRQGELAALGQALDAAVEGGSAVVLVGGEAGVGKSRLVQEFAGLAESRRRAGVHRTVPAVRGDGLAAGPVG